MDKIMFLAMQAGDRYLTAQTVHANNLANANTPGFKAELAAFTDLDLSGAQHATTSTPVYNQSYVDMSPGALKNTHRKLDVAITGDGFLSVQTLGGREAYTRKGDLQISEDGILVTRAGDMVLGDNGPIFIPTQQQLSVAMDGSVSIQPVGAPATDVEYIDHLKLVNPGLSEIQKEEDGLFYPLSGQAFDADSNVTIMQGALEASNVNMVHEMLAMMDMARSFEMQLKLMKTAEQDDAAAARLMRMS